MIIDKIENAEKYYNAHPEFKAVFEVLASLDAESEEKRRDVNGNKAFVNLSSYVNKPAAECKFEAHAKYADIQYVVTGHEYIDVTPSDGLTATEDKLAESDIAFYENPTSFTRADLTEKTFVVLFPGEAHRPLVAPDDKGIRTKKAVAKIAMK